MLFVDKLQSTLQLYLHVNFGMRAVNRVLWELFMMSVGGGGGCQGRVPVCGNH